MVLNDVACISRINPSSYLYLLFNIILYDINIAFAEYFIFIISHLFMSYSVFLLDSFTETRLPNFFSDVPKPRYVRVNTLKLDVDSAIKELGKKCTVSLLDFFHPFSFPLVGQGVGMNNSLNFETQTVFSWSFSASIIMAVPQILVNFFIVPCLC